jgi:integrase
MAPRIYQLAKEAVHDKSPDDFLLTRKGNRRVRDFRRTWEKLCASAGLQGLLVHDLRRSAARNLRRAGVAESVVMEIGGWKTRSVFLRYDIVNIKDRKTAMEQLEQQRVSGELIPVASCRCNVHCYILVAWLGPPGNFFLGCR